MESTCLWNSLPFACRSVVINLGCNDDLVIWFSAVIPWKRKSRKMTLNYLCISYGGELSPSRSFWFFSSSSFSTCSLTTEVTVWHSLLFLSSCGAVFPSLCLVGCLDLPWGRMLQNAAGSRCSSACVRVDRCCQPGSWCWDSQVRG